MPLDDQQLMQLVTQGKTEFFDELVSRYRSALMRVALSKLHDGSDAEDAVQDTFLAVVRSKHSFDASRSFRGWLWTILLNNCRHIHERTQRDRSRQVALASLPVSEEPALHETSLSILLARERVQLVHELLARLSEVQADALRLRFFGELKFEEIAEVMGCSLNAAKDRVRRGLLRLAELPHECQSGEWL